MKQFRWTDHALRNLVDHEIPRDEAERAAMQPEFTVSDPPDRELRMRRYFDAVLGEDMLLRVVVEETPAEIVVVTAYKTSQIRRYLKGLM